MPLQEITFKNMPQKIVLIVEDDTPDQVLIENRIRSLWPDCNIIAVKSLLGAYKAFKKYTFDVVILDLNLQDTMGPRTIAEIKKFNRTVPLIVLTGVLTPITIRESMKYGVENIFPKSKLMEDDFLSVVESVSQG